MKEETCSLCSLIFVLNEPNKRSNTCCSSHQKDNIPSFCQIKNPLRHDSSGLLTIVKQIKKNHKNSISFVGFLYLNLFIVVEENIYILKKNTNDTQSFVQRSPKVQRQLSQLRQWLQDDCMRASWCWERLQSHKDPTIRQKRKYFYLYMLLHVSKKQRIQRVTHQLTRNRHHHHHHQHLWEHILQYWGQKPKRSQLQTYGAFKNNQDWGGKFKFGTF